MNSFKLSLQALDSRDVPAADNFVTFTLDNGIDCEAAFDIYPSLVDPDVEGFKVSLNDVSVSYDGINLAGDLEEAVAVFNNGAFEAIQLVMRDNQEAVPGLESMHVTTTSALARYDSGPDVYVNTNLEWKPVAAIGLDFAGITTGVAQTITVRVTTDDNQVVEVTVHVTADATAGAIRDLVKAALQGKGITCESGGDTRITIQGHPNVPGQGPGADVTKVEITSTAGGFVPPKKTGTVPSNGGVHPVYNPAK